MNCAVFSLRDRIYRPRAAQRQWRIAVPDRRGAVDRTDVSIRYAPRSGARSGVARSLPEDIDGEVVRPAVQGCFTERCTVHRSRNLSTKRQES